MYFEIDETKFYLILPNFLMEYLINNKIYGVFIEKDGTYYLNNNVDEKTKFIILDKCFELLCQDVGMTVCEYEELFKEFNSIGHSMRQADFFAKHYANNEEYDKSNKIILSQLKTLATFRERMLNSEEPENNSYKKL